MREDRREQYLKASECMVTHCPGCRSWQGTLGRTPRSGRPRQEGTPSSSRCRCTQLLVAPCARNNPAELGARGAVLGHPADTATQQKARGRSAEQQPPAPQPNSMMRLMMGCAPNGAKLAIPEGETGRWRRLDLKAKPSSDGMEH